MRKWSELKEHLRFKYGPLAANFLIRLSTLSAKRKLKGTPLRVLVDNTVLYHGVTHETAWVPTGTKNWGGVVDVKTGYSARVSVYSPDSTSREHTNVTYLAGIAELARKGFLELLTSAELADERFRQPAGRFHGYGWHDFNILADINMASVDGYCLPSMGFAYQNLPSPAEQQRARLRALEQGDNLFRQLVDVLGRNNSQDAWHIRTAEVHRLFCFMTMDFRLLKTLEGSRKLEPICSLRTKIMTPAELGMKVGLLPIPPSIFAYHNASWFIRADIAMPDNKRRPFRAYRKGPN
jgi:hypothetical protein